MKKLLLVVFTLLCFTAFSQNTFTRTYYQFVIKEDGKLKSDPQTCDVLFVINEQGTNDVVMYTGDNKVLRYHKVDNVRRSTTTSGDKYQAIECVDNKGRYCTVQLFNEGEIRIIYKDGYVEFF